ncbi:hypothetical protein ASD62_17700 [Phycicoccus sp. Root563]|uniref:hypothetical protein n=1 Tax=Phycicoccus sp. Root563 TaxID=1736562 RepID=UPI000702508A|nr:hypothetical protein [Phycicoccus sp. Root563]KQZ87420.1 hypothetical protein ASD62_17700 [Phycicoccus sp. Root563]
MTPSPWTIRPQVGVGTLCLGDPIADAHRTLTETADFEHTVQSAPYSGHFSNGITVALDADSAGLLESIEIWYPIDPNTTTVTLEGVNVFAADVDTTSARLRAVGLDLSRHHDSLIDRGRSIGLTVADKRIVAALVGVAGYYDFLDDLP